MKNRTRCIISMLLTMAMVLSNIMPVFAEEIVEETSIMSVEDGNWSEKWVGNYDFRIVNDPGNFTEIANSPYSDVVLTTFTNVYEEFMITAYSEYADKVFITNKGTITVSDNFPKHGITIYGYDGHGEEFYINRNMFSITNEELNNIKLGERIIDNIDNYSYYEPIDGLYVRDESKKAQLQGEHGYLTISMDIVHNNYDYTDNNDNQTWIKITYTGKEESSEDTPIEDSEVIPDWIKEGKVREYIGNNEDYIEVLSENTYNGKKQKPIVTVSYNGNTYSNEKGGLLKVKYSKNKNCGEVTATITKIKGKGNKEISRELKGMSIEFNIIPIVVSDNNIKVKKKKNGNIRSIKVDINGKYKKVPKKMWSIVGNNVEFSGNYTGSVSVNSL